MKYECQVLLHAMREAGAAILALQKTDYAISKKSNNDIVTQADLLANDILKTQLLTHFPQDGWLSEESVDEPSRLQCERVWVVDPIDGTKEFAAKVPEYALSVALVVNQQPVLAAVFNPAVGELYYAVKGGGAYLGDTKIHCREQHADKLLLLASRSEYQRGEWDIFAKQHDVQQVGSIAYKLALVAAGRADATFSLGPKSEWDIAAGVLLVMEAGGIVTTKHHQPFLFNSKQVCVDSIVASAAHLSKKIFALIA